LVLFLLILLAAAGGLAEQEPDLSETQVLYGIAWGPVGGPYPGVENPGQYVNVSLSEAGNGCAVLVPEELGGPAGVNQRGLKLWLDMDALMKLRLPVEQHLLQEDINYVLIEPVAIALIGEWVYGPITAFGDDFVELSVVYGSEEREETPVRIAITDATAILWPLAVGGTYDVLYDEDDIALMIKVANG